MNKRDVFSIVIFLIAVVCLIISLLVRDSNISRIFAAIATLCWGIKWIEIIIHE